MSSNNSLNGNIKINSNYFVNGSDVIFKLGDLDFTFKNFIVQIREESMIIKLTDEAPMNLINLLGTVNDVVGVNKKNVLDSDKVDLILQIDNDLFREFKPRILKCTEAKDIFDLDMKGFQFLKDLENYYLIEYSMSKMKASFHLGGKLGNFIRRKGKF